MTSSPNIVVFLGPTLRRAKAEQFVDVRFRPPAAMGDITRAVVDHFDTIVLIDGVFESGPSVWHKEILWALSRGVTVIGASSMGALRAAELADHGMTGYGAVFEAFASGHLEDDDEVAVLHGPAETGWAALTDAMVDIRGYADMACESGLLNAHQAAQVINHAKGEHFKRRSFLLSCEAVMGTRSAGIADWHSSMPSGIKETDCSNLLANMSSVIAAAETRLKNVPAFSPTVYLSRLQEFGFQFQH